MTRRQLTILALAIVGLAVVQWFVVPGPAPVRAAASAEAPWKLPERAAFDAPKALLTLKTSALWGKLPDIVPEAPLNPPEWRFLGAMVRDKDRQVIIQIEGQPEQRLVPGDILPGGSQILKIESDRLCLLIEGQKRSLAIYPDGPLSGTMPRQEETPTRSSVAQRNKRQTP